MEEIIKMKRLKLRNASNPGGENIFKKVSQETGAEVIFEAGCKTLPLRKEPCIKIKGTEENVRRAKELLIERMEMQSNRVVLKMDVTHYEHPCMIGKHGKLIKKVMEATSCHIHFPDSNKDSSLEKSNQVSIYGDPNDVERAKVMLRALIPIQIHFEVPLLGSLPFHVDMPPSGIVLIGSISGLDIYMVQKQNTQLIVFRCSQDTFSECRKQIAILMECICCINGANLPPVHIVTNIMSHNHAYVKGVNNSNVEGIMKRTGAKITFPDFNSLLHKKTSVVITGSLDCVYMAWQEIMNYLPVSVSFDINETRDTKGEYMNFLQDLGICVSSFPKPTYFIKNVVVKGFEKYSKQMLQYRQHLLRLPSINFKPDIQEINLANDLLSSLSDYFHSSVSYNIPPAVAALVNDDIPFETHGNMATTITGTSILTGSIQMHLSNLSELMPVKTTEPKGYTSNLLQMDLNSQYAFSQNSPLEKFSTLTESDESLSPPNYMNENAVSSTNLEKNRDLAVAEDYYRKKALAARAMRRPIESMDSAQVPSSLWAGYGFSQSMPASVIKEKMEASNQYSFGSGSSSCSSEDSDSWESIFQTCKNGNIWSAKKESTFSHSNYFDVLPNISLSFGHGTKDILPELLWQHGFHKYIDVFTKEEIDFQTFVMLTEQDLHQLNISHQDRIKILCLIRELQDAKVGSNSKTFDAAPGAGRK